MTPHVEPLEPDIPIWSEDAERCALSALLFGGPAFAFEAATRIEDAAWFYAERHRALWRALLALAERGAEFDPPLVTDALTTAGDLDRMGGPAGLQEFMLELADEAIPPARLTHYARLLHDRYLRRLLAREARAAMLAAGDFTKPAHALVRGTVEQLADVAARRSEARNDTPIAQFGRVLERIEQRVTRGSRVIGVPTGLRDLDNLTDGWRPGRLILVCARPADGKTSFALHCAEHAARKGHRTVFSTAEQPTEELQERRLGSALGLACRDVITARQLDEVVPRTAPAINVLAARPLLFTQDALSPSAVRLEVQRVTAKAGPVSLVVADHLGLYSSGENADSTVRELHVLTRAFARLAIELEVPVLLLTQLNRESARPGPWRRPGLTDIRGSGHIEENAGQILFLVRNPEWPGAKVEIDVQKNKWGPVGSVEAMWDKATGRWRGWSHREEPGSQDSTAGAA